MYIYIYIYKSYIYKSYLEYACVLHVVVLKQRKDP